MEERESAEGRRHRLEVELEQRLRADPEMFEFLRRSSLDGLWYWDLEEPEHEWMSPEFWQLFGIDPDTRQHLASEWQDIIFPEDRDLALENFERHCADPEHPYDQVVRYLHADGTTVWVRCRGLAIRDEHGRPIRMLGAHNDLTALKRVEAELTAQVGRAAAANDELAAFAYAISHDLKSPLNTLGLLMAELEHELTDASDEVRQLLELGRATATRAAGLIEDVLDYTRVVGEPVRREVVPLAGVVKAVDADLAADIQAAGAEVHLDVPADCEVWGSRSQIHLLVQNLLSNAVKFRSADRPHRVDVGARRRSDGTVDLTVSDNGVGMRPDQLDRIFDMFERLHSQQTFEGAGLGLTLCRRVVTNHGGTIRVTSELGRGSRFEVELPGRNAP